MSTKDQIQETIEQLSIENKVLNDSLEWICRRVEDGKHITVSAYKNYCKQRSKHTQHE